HANTFSISPMFTASLPVFLPPQEPEPIAFTLGLYSEFASKINTSTDLSIINAFYTFDIGETNSIHFFASKDIPKGTELIIPYTPADDSLLTQAVSLAKYKIYNDESPFIEEEEELLSFVFEGADVEVVGVKFKENVSCEHFDLQLSSGTGNR